MAKNNQPGIKRFVRSGSPASTMLLLVALTAQGADLSVVGDWSASIGPTELVAGAGTEIRSPIESLSSQAQIDIDNTGDTSWTLWVRRVDSGLPAGVTLAVRRTSSGSGAGTVLGGEGYLSVSESEQVLFYGSGDLRAIGLQLRLDGVSIDQGPGTYAGTLHYRIN